MFPMKQLTLRTSHRFLLILIVLQVTLTQSVTVNPNQDKSESSTATSQRNWKSSFIRNNKEIKFIPSQKEDNKKNSDDASVENENSALSKTYLFGQRKQNLENSGPGNATKTRRTNFLASLKARNNTKSNINKESNKIDIILLPQDESDEVSTRPSTYRRRYRKKNRQQHRNTEKHEDDEDKQEDSKKDGAKKEETVKKVENKNQDETSEDASISRLFNKNKRRLFGNRHSNNVQKEAPKVNEKENEEEKVEKIEKTEKENIYKLDLSESKKEESKVSMKETKGHNFNRNEDKSEDKSPEESTENFLNKEKDYENSDKLLQKYRFSSTPATSIEILSTHPSNAYFQNNSYNKVNTNGLSNMQLLHTLGMRKVRQPNHHKKRHQQESKSRSQYNINSDSQMYIVKLPPQPYYYHNEKSTYNLKPKNNLPIKMVNNGKIDKVYHYNLPLVEKLMTGRKTYSNKVHKIHDPVQPYFGPYSHNEYEVMSKKPLENKNPFTSNKKFDSDSFSGNSYHKSESVHENNKVIPVHEDNASFEDSSKVLDSRHDLKFTPSEEIKKVNDYKHFDPYDAYNKFDAQEEYKKFDEKSEYEKFNPSEGYKSFDIKYDFEKSKPSDSKTFESPDDYKHKVTKPWSHHNKGSKVSNYDSNIYNIKPSQSFGSSPSFGFSSYDGNSLDKTYLGDKNFRNFDRVKSSSVSPIYMKPYVHRYYTNNGRPKSIYVLPQYHKT